MKRKLQTIVKKVMKTNLFDVYGSVSVHFITHVYWFLLYTFVYNCNIIQYSFYFVLRDGVKDTLN